MTIFFSLCACGPAPPTASNHSSPVAAATHSYAGELASATRAIEQAQRAASAPQAVWTQLESLAEKQIARAQLTGDYADYLAAQQSLQSAFERAGKGGPYLSRARWNFAVHRLDAAAADLAIARQDRNADPATLTALAADITFYRGNYTEALDGYREALQQREDLGNLVRLSIWHARMGHASEAAALLDRADKQYHGNSTYPRAWLALQQGLLRLERGDLPTALAWYSRALELLPGWWLAREHVAEVHALMGQHEAALREYKSVVMDTGHPEYMDAIALIYQAQNRPELAQPWIAKARAAYEQRLAQLPEATYGHGLDHFLNFGTAEETLRLAQSNAHLRPYGEARLQLAQALLRIGCHRQALAEARAVSASGWNTAEAHALLAQMLERNGRASEAVASWRRALAMNPLAARMYLFAPVSSR